MYPFITSLTLRNYRCHKLLVLDGLQHLVVLVGENDAGKTAVLSAIDEILSGPSRFNEGALHRCESDTPESYEIIAKIVLQPPTDCPKSWNFVTTEGKTSIRVRKIATRETSSIEVEAFVPTDPRATSFKTLSAVEQKAYLEELGITPLPRKAERNEAMEELVAARGVAGSTGWSPLDSQSRALLLPPANMISSSSYRSAQTVVQSALRSVVRDVLEPLVDGERSELQSLVSIRQSLTERLNEELESLEAMLRNAHHQQVREVRAKPVIDFTRSLTTVDLELNLGTGLQPLSSFGLGTNRRAWMGAIDWERSRSLGTSIPEVRLYDEPDAGLHYSAQQRLLSSILQHTQQHGVQCFIATHSLAIIDRVAPESIRLILPGPNGVRQVSRIKSDAGDVSSARDVARAVGLSNTALLYERAFLLVEGPSEAGAFPLLYERITGKSIEADGVVVVNLASCGAWRPVVSVLFQNRISRLHLLLDSDCKAPESAARLTPTNLAEAGCPSDFVQNQVTFVGAKELEDAFTDGSIARMLNAEFPRDDGRQWTEEDVSPARASNKFSEEIPRLIYAHSVPSTRSSANKPFIATALAKHTPQADLPTALVEVVNAIQSLASG